MYKREVIVNYGEMNIYCIYVQLYEILFRK